MPTLHIVLPGIPNTLVEELGLLLYCTTLDTSVLTTEAVLMISTQLCRVSDFLVTFWIDTMLLWDSYSTIIVDFVKKSDCMHTLSFLNKKRKKLCCLSIFFLYLCIHVFKWRKVAMVDTFFLCIFMCMYTIYNISGLVLLTIIGYGDGSEFR